MPPESKREPQTLGTLLAWLIPPLIVFILFCGAWAGIVAVTGVREFFIPSPQRVLEELWEHRTELSQATLRTGIVSLSGFALSLTIGTLAAFVMAQTKVLERCFYPYAIFLQTVPIVAIAPIIIIWFGPGIRSVIVISFIISLFPVITNTTTGLANLPRERVELMRIYRARWWEVLIKLRIPGAVPYIITGARISAGLSVVGAIVGEYFTSIAGSSYGIAYLVVVNAENARTAYLFATTLMSAMLGLLIFAVVTLIGNLVLRYGHFGE